MTPYETLFKIGSTAALLSWALLILLPGWRVTKLVTRGLVPVLLAAAYAGLVLEGWTRTGGGFGSLADLRTLFQSDALLTAGWLHYLAFDLLIGTWIASEGRARGIPHWTLVPALLLTFLFGPAGFGLFLVQRMAWGIAGKAGTASSDPLSSISAWLRASEPLLVAAGLAMAATLLPTAFAAWLDIRIFADEAIWLKPLRFEIALAVYLLSLAVFMPFAGPTFRSTRLGQFVIWAAIIGAFLEGGYIALQAARGMGSHYNMATPVYQMLYVAMGVTAVVLTAAAPALAIGIARAPALPADHRWAALRLSIVLGLILTFVLGGLAGMYLSAMPGHFGKVASGGATLPIVGWSRTTGDFRIAHFLGIHAMHALPVVGLLAAGIRSASTARFVVFAAAAVYSAATVATFLQAVAGRALFPL